MKFLPFLRPTALLLAAATLAACSTPANRRELYNTSDSKSGAWHDYDRRRQAEAETGVSGGVAPSALPNSGKPTAQPSSVPAGTPGPLPPGASVPSTPTMQEPLTPASSAVIPNVPPPADVAPPPAATDNAVPTSTTEPTTPPAQ